MDATPLDQVQLGLDIGSVTAKLVMLSPAPLAAETARSMERIQPFHGRWLAAARVAVLGDPLQAALRLVAMAPPAKSLLITGVHGKRISTHLQTSYINEFKAISAGVAALLPGIRTIIEIGGDHSRYLQIEFRGDGREPAILDYERNGDCAAGTGSFIDQQAQRLRYPVEEIGSLVLTADSAATIAGRCSVFAKSDMVHAQQRGYSPAAILKGLCEAVVRNYIGTILRGKTIEPPVAFVGGVAANAGVVQAMHQLLGLGPHDLIVPPEHFYAAALGCALAAHRPSPHPQVFSYHLKRPAPPLVAFQPQRLTLDRVDFPKLSRLPHPSADRRRVYLGIDVGSVSTNLVLIDEQGEMVDEIYTRTEGRPVEVVQREFSHWQEKWGQRVQVMGVGTTGSGRELAGELVGADTVNDEITAHKTGAAFIAQRLGQDPVDTIFEIGGQDSKFISIEDGVVVDFTMNEACAAGTGSFLEEQAAKLGIPIINEFAELALAAENPVQLGERCTVFMEKDVSAYLQQGVAKKDIAAGLAFSVALNYLNRVVRDRHIGNLIYFQGGTAYNQAVAAAFSALLNKRIVVPPHHGVIGAIGAALLARDAIAEHGHASKFHGFDLNIDFSIRQFRCQACSNQCDIQQITVNDEKTFWGDKCSDRYRKRIAYQAKPLLPNLLDLYQELLSRDTPGADGLGLRIGFPKSLYYYDRFPFWRGYFGALGAELVVTETTNRPIVSLGRKHCIAEPCFPILAAHGHVVHLFEQKSIDYVFVANAINSETEFPQTESWFCPWGQTLPLVLDNSFGQEAWRQRLLRPVVRFRDGEKAVENALYPMAKNLGVSRRRHRHAIHMAYTVQKAFQQEIKTIGVQALQTLQDQNRSAVVLVGRAYNLYDPGLNLNIPAKLREMYGMDVLPMDFLPCTGIDISPWHENMFWNYGRKILQAAVWTGRQKNLHLIYITNFKCGPDSYIKHFVRDALGAPYLTLQFDEHSNDAGAFTRVEAYLQSKGVLAGRRSMGPIEYRQIKKSQLVDQKLVQG